MNYIKKFLKHFGLLVFVFAAVACFAEIPTDAASENQEIIAEVVNLNTIFSDTNSEVSFFDAETGTIDLKKGNYERWIDRINVPDYALDFYDTLEEYCDNDGIDDLMIDDSGFSKDTAEVINFGPGYGSDTFHAIKYVTIKNPTQNDVDYIYKTMRAVFEAFDMDHPEVFWLSGSTSGYGLTKGSEYTFYFLIKMHEGSYSDAFDMRADEYRASGSIEQNIAIRDEAVEKILNTDTVKNASSDYETVKAFNEWLTKNNEYNYDVILNPPEGRTIAHRCISALKGSSGANAPVCEGYSKAFKVLCDKMGIPCVVTTGDAYSTPADEPEAHSWNCVKIGGVWYLADITWNDPLIVDMPGIISGYENEDYLLVGENTEINDMKFKDSHIPANILSVNGIGFINGPITSQDAYVEQDTENPEPENPDPEKPDPEKPDPEEPQPEEPEPDHEIIRLAGATRYETSFAIAQKYKETSGIDKFQTIIIASGKSFADALAGSYLAGKTNAPILMTNGKNTDALCDFILENLEIGGTVYLLGGNAAVSENIESALYGLGNIIRLSGSSRYDTNLEILKEAGVEDEEILVCTGKNFADSLSGSAARKPILLVNNKALTDSQKTFLAEHSGNKLYIIGGEGAVNKDLEQELKLYGETERISGATRYETSVLLAEKFFENPSKAVLAYAKNFPDGLCGGALAMSMDAPLILTAIDKESAAADYMQEHQISSGVVLGGDKLISDYSAHMIFGLNSDDTE